MNRRTTQMNARTNLRIGVLLLPLLAALGIACPLGARAVGVATPVTALLAVVALALALGAVAPGAVLFGTARATTLA